jgi:D-alanyl-lipoteichoic acid acyltransferase DltB (MBOAT superfamily)
MVAGPIERPYNLLPQIHRNPTATYDTFRSGIQIALWGAFKKLVVADFVAQAVTNVYAQPHLFSGPILLFTTFLFSIQIYCDFSGYSDIAIGIGRMMGYELMVNFRQPYFSRSIAEFWRRWHISLSTWFRDYVYLALGGSHVSKARHLVNVLIVFMVSGLWHGANWTFLIWGMLHGLYYIAGSLTAPARARLTSGMTSGWARAGHAAFQMAFTFSLISLAWVFFRAATVSDAMYIVTHFFDWHRFSIIELETMGLPKVGAAMALSFIAIMAIVEWLMAHKDTFVSRLWSSSRTVRWAGYYACVFGIVFFGVFEHVAFIYFQF